MIEEEIVIKKGCIYVSKRKLKGEMIQLHHNILVSRHNSEKYTGRPRVLKKGLD